MIGFDFDGMRRDREAMQKICSRAAAGMGPEHLVPGAIVTVGPNHAIGSRSYGEAIFEVLASNAGTVLLGFAHGRRSYDKEPTVLLWIHEQNFYPAEHLLEAVRTASEGQKQESA